MVDLMNQYQQAGLHRLATLAGLSMHMFKQQQRGGAPSLEHLAPVGLGGRTATKPWRWSAPISLP
jgi:acyl dehydratase